MTQRKKKYKIEDSALRCVRIKVMLLMGARENLLPLLGTSLQVRPLPRLLAAPGGAQLTGISAQQLAYSAQGLHLKALRHEIQFEIDPVPQGMPVVKLTIQSRPHSPLLPCLTERGLWELTTSTHKISSFSSQPTASCLVSQKETGNKSHSHYTKSAACSVHSSTCSPTPTFLSLCSHVLCLLQKPTFLLFVQRQHRHKPRWAWWEGS